MNGRCGFRKPAIRKNRSPLSASIARTAISAVLPSARPLSGTSGDDHTGPRAVFFFVLRSRCAGVSVRQPSAITFASRRVCHRAFSTDPHAPGLAGTQCGIVLERPSSSPPCQILLSDAVT